MTEADHTYPPVTTSRLEAIDGLRGVAALIVVVYHCFTTTGMSEFRIHRINVLRPLHDGWCGVNLFLVLSGFCLYWPFARRPNRRLDLREFAVKRVRRIVPAYYLSLLVVALAAVAMHRAGWLPPVDPNNGLGDTLGGPRGPLDVALHAVLLHSLWWRSIWSWNNVTWSLGLEWLWYMVFPLAVWFFRRYGAARGLLMGLVVTVVYRTAVYYVVGPASSFPDPQIAKTVCWRAFVTGRLFEFTAGMYVAWAAAQGRFPRWAIRAAPAAFVALLVAAHLATPVDPMLPARDLLYGAAFAALMAVAVAAREGWISRALAFYPLICVGEWSYSLYLMHMPVVIAARVLLQRAGVSGPALFVATLSSIPVAVVVAWLCYVGVERPFILNRQGRAAEVFTDPAQAIAP